MKFGDLLSASWKLYRLHFKTIVTILFLCTFLPFVVMALASQGIAYSMGVTGTLAQYSAAQEHYRELLSSTFLEGTTAVLAQTLEAQRLVIVGLQQELLPFFVVQGILGAISGLIGLLGAFALLGGFFGKFGSASSLLRDARKGYLSLFGTLLALVFIFVLGGVILFFGLLLIALLAKSIALFSEPLGFVLGIGGFIGLCWIGVYWLLGICFTLYEAFARKTRGFAAVRGAWAHMKGKRLVVMGQSLLLSLTLLVCFLPLLLLQVLVRLGTFEVIGTGIDSLFLIAYMFVAMPIIYFFYGFLYKRL